jgi:hypothetical protein
VPIRWESPGMSRIAMARLALPVLLTSGEA